MHEVNLPYQMAEMGNELGVRNNTLILIDVLYSMPPTTFLIFVLVQTQLSISRVEAPPFKNQDVPVRTIATAMTTQTASSY